MTKPEMFLEMMQLQRNYDLAVNKEFGTEYEIHKTYLALIDEIGEVNHELKSVWCWWKKTQKPVDWNKVLEELADCWHFALSIYYHDVDDFYGKSSKDKFLSDADYLFEEDIQTDYFIKKYQRRDVWKLHECMSDIAFSMIAFNTIEQLLTLSAWCGFQFEDIYKAYKKKNKINYERLKNGY